MVEFNKGELEKLLGCVEYYLDNFKDAPLRYFELRDKLYNEVDEQPGKILADILGSEKAEEIKNRLYATMKMLKQSIVKKDLK